MKNNTTINIIRFTIITALILTGFTITIRLNFHPSFSPLTVGSLKDSTQVKEKVDTHIGQLKDLVNNSNDVTQSAISKEPNSLLVYPTVIRNRPSEVLAAASTAKCELLFTFLPNVKDITPGGIIIYKVNLKNIGKLTCQNASFSLYYGENVKFQSSAPRPFAGNYYWVIGNFKPGEEYDVTVSMKHNDSDVSEQIRNEGCATANNGIDACAENIVLINSQAQDIPEPISIQTNATNTFTPLSSSQSVADNSKKLVVPQNKEFGTWIWESPTQMSENYAIKLLQSASESGINAVYITIDDYLNIAGLPESAKKDQLKRTYFESLSRIIVEAKALGIQVDVEGGAKDWAIKTNHWKGYALIDFVKEYNKRYPNAKVRNFQYDVEPYLLNSYESNKANVLTSFIEFIDKSTTQMQEVDAGFSVVIPHFYDSGQKWTPAVNYNGSVKYTFSHLLSILEKKPGSTIIIMSYRNFFYGNNGTQQISEAEIKEASNGGFNTNIIIAQETGNVAPDYVTFYGHTRKEFFDTILTIYNDFSSFQSFSGTSAHYIDSFLALE